MTPTYTGFFREPNIAEFSHSLAPEMAKQVGGRLLVAEVGCSSGQETWSLSSALLANGVDHHIEAFDTDDEVLLQAAGPYEIFEVESLRRIQEDSAYPAGCLSHFIISSTVSTDSPYKAQIRPSHVLQSHASFERRDIIDERLEPERYHAAVVNNVLFHYSQPFRDKLMRHVVDGLRPGGVLMVEDFSRKRNQDYLLWRLEAAQRFGLLAVRNSQQEIPTIFTKPPAQSA